MATYLQRGQAICDALINSPSTASQQLRLGRALAHRDGLLAEFDAGTNAQKAEMFVRAFRRTCLRAVRDLEGEDAAGNARSTAEAQVDAGFPEAP